MENNEIDWDNYGKPEWKPKKEKFIERYMKKFGETTCHINILGLKLGITLNGFHNGKRLVINLIFVHIAIALNGEIGWWLGKYYIRFLSKMHYSPKGGFKNNWFK